MCSPSCGRSVERLALRWAMCQGPERPMTDHNPCFLPHLGGPLTREISEAWRVWLAGSASCNLFLYFACDGTLDTQPGNIAPDHLRKQTRKGTQTHTETQIHTQIQIHTERHTDAQTHTDTDTQTYRHIETETLTHRDT